MLIILLLAVQFASAKSVDEIIDRYLRARGGRDKLAAVKSIYMEGKKEVMGEVITVKITKEQEKLSRTQIKTESTDSFLLITDKAAWTYFSDKSQEIKIIPEEDMAGFNIEMDISGPLVDYQLKGYTAVLLGKEIIEDNACYKIKLTTKAGKGMMFWIDINSYLVLQSSGTNMGMENKASFTLHKNYKEVEGIQFAHTFIPRSQKINDNALDEEIIFHTIQVNPVIDPKLYEPVI